MISCELASLSAAIFSSVIEHRPALISPMCSSTCSTSRCSAERTPTGLQSVFDGDVGRERTKPYRESRQLRDRAHHYIVSHHDGDVREAWVETLHPLLQPLADLYAGALHAPQVDDVREPIEARGQLFEAIEQQVEGEERLDRHLVVHEQSILDLPHTRAQRLDLLRGRVRTIGSRFDLHHRWKPSI